MSTELAIREGQDSFTAKQLAALEQLGVGGASRADQAIFFHQCVRTGLDPFARQIYMIGRKVNEDGQWKIKQTIQTGIDGFRLIARRAADRRKETLGYEDDLWCGEDGVWREVWLSSDPPAAAKVTVLRNGQPFPAVAVFAEFKQTKSNGELTKMWRDKPSHMIQKCAEALALRKAFPQDLSGLYTEDETGIEAPEEPATVDPASTGTRRMSRRPRPVAPVPDPELPEDDPSAEFDPAHTSNPAPSDEPLTSGQSKLIHTLFGKLGITDRDERLAEISAVVGRDIDSSNDLTKAEATRLVDRLRDRIGPGPDLFEEDAS